MKQLDHERMPFAEKRFPLVLVCDGIKSPANAGSLLRLADAFNVEEVVFCGAEVNLSSNRLKRTARATINSVLISQRNNILDVCLEYSKEGYALLALEITNDSVPVEGLEYGDYSKIALILGNESVGISEEVLELSHRIVHINMFGKNSSINVAQAAGIALFEITKSLKPVS